MKTFIIIPTYNEAENVRPIVERVLEFVPEASVLVVDDNSPDGTGRIADEMAAADPRVHVLHRPGKQGLGKAYIAGFQYALEHGADRIIEMDADFSHDPRYLPELIKLCDEYDVVIGSRWVAGGGVANWPLSRQILSRFGNAYARAVIWIPLRDGTAGFKCYRRQVLEQIAIHDIQSTGYSFQLETVTRALRHGFTIKETPIVFVERAAGVSKMSKAIVLEAMKMAWKLRGYRPKPSERPQLESQP